MMKVDERVAFTKDRLTEAMREMGKTQADLGRETGLDRASISRYVAGENEPSQDAAYRLARALNVSEMWLWGYDVPKARTLVPNDSDDASIAYAKPQTNVNEIYNRIITLCKMRGIKGAKMCTDIGVSKSLLTDMKMGRKNGVSAVNAQKIASYFGVSVAYLLGEEEPVAEISYAQAIDKLAKLIENKEFCELFESYSRLNAKNKQIVKRLITDLSV